MSTATSNPREVTPGAIDISATQSVPFSRLVKVELRKMVDTRSGFWLLFTTGILLVLASGISLLVVGLNDNVSLNATDISQILTIPLSLLLPVFAIQTVTSEWSQRTALVSFTLEANRVRVLTSKLSAVVLLALGTILLAVVLGAILNLAGAAVGGYDATWNLEASGMVATVATQLLYFMMAFGIGAVVLSTPAAIALFYVVALMLPLMVYGTLMAFFEWARDLIPWIDLQFASAPFFESWSDLGGKEIGQLIVATVIWVVIPLVVGTKRVMTTEPK
ncbi:MAG: ABC transporter permease [Nocardioides sp.]|nr:ABC transporter permease [Nocardioides sp.]